MKRKHGLSITERLEASRVVRGDCWETSLSPNKKYPQIKIDGQNVMVHRASYEAHVGKIPTGLSVLHRCDNPRCHRPEHLFLGTLSDNMHDMWDKQRHEPPRQRVPFENLAEMSKTMTQKQIAEAVGLSQTAVSYALRKLGKSRGRGTSFRAHKK